MNWFYSEDEMEIGPLTEEVIHGLCAAGTIDEDTQVRRDDSNQWMPYRTAFEHAINPLSSSQAGHFKFHCPQCEQRIAADATRHGLVAACPSCGGDVVVLHIDTGEGHTPTESEPLSEVKSETPPVDDSPREPDEQHNFTALESFSSEIAEAAKTGWSGLKRRSKAAAISGQIQKLKGIDLKKAYFKLGKKCYEERFLQEELKEQFDAIQELDEAITEKQQREEVAADETKVAMAKRVASSAAKASHVKALGAKRLQLVTQLGRAAQQYIGAEPPGDLKRETDAIQDLDKKLDDLEEASKTLKQVTTGRRVPRVAVVVAILFVLGCGVVLLIPRGHSDAAADPLLTGARGEESSKEIAPAPADRPIPKITAREPLNVQGIWIGMSEKSARKKIGDIFGRNLEWEKGKLYEGHLQAFRFSVPDLLRQDRWSPYCNIEIDTETNKLAAFRVSGTHFDKMFDSEGLQFTEFSQQFMAHFGISKLMSDESTVDLNDPKRVYYHTDRRIKLTFITRLNDPDYKSFAMSLLQKASF